MMGRARAAYRPGMRDTQRFGGSALLMLSLALVGSEARAQGEDDGEAHDEVGGVDHELPIDEDALLDALEATPDGPTSSRAWPAWDHRGEPAFTDLVRGRMLPRDEELSALARDGFVVLSRDAAHFARAYHTIYTEDLPVFVTMDSLFHAVAAGQEKMGATLEERWLVPTTERALRAMHTHLAQTWSAWPMAQELDTYLAVARSLLAGRPAAMASPTPDARERDLWLSRVHAARPAMDAALFGRAHPLDLSLATPRGRYAGHPVLERWFRAMWWLGHVELNLVSRDCRSSTAAESNDPRETPEEVVLALALAHLAQESGALDALGGLSDTLDDLVAPRVDMAPDALLWLAGDAGIDHDALVAEAPEALQRRLAAAIGDDYARTARTHVMPHGAVRMPVIATLLGVRPTEGTLALEALLAPRVPGRAALDGLDVAYALGHDRAKALLGRELVAWPDLGRGLDAARQHFAGAPAMGTLRLAWLQAVRALAAAPSAAAPSFMRRTAWADQRIASAVAAYAQLRHAHVLYEAQSFSVGGCDIPDGFVEPAPEVLAALRAFAARGRALAARIDRDGALGVAAYFERMDRVFAALARIVAHELAGRALDEAERRFLHQVAEEEAGSYSNTMTFDGWFYDLFFVQARQTWDRGAPDAQFGQRGKPADGYYHDEVDFLAPADLVVDVATTVGDGGGRVSHLGTRPPRFALFVVDTGGPPRVMVGPVADAYVQVTPWPRRLTDQAARAEPEADRRSPWAGHAPWLRRADPEPDLQATAMCDDDEVGWYVDAVADRPTPIELRFVDDADRVVHRQRAVVGSRRMRIQLPRDPTRPAEDGLCATSHGPIMIIGPRVFRFFGDMGIGEASFGRFRAPDEGEGAPD